VRRCWMMRRRLTGPARSRRPLGWLGGRLGAGQGRGATSWRVACWCTRIAWQKPRGNSQRRCAWLRAMKRLGCGWPGSAWDVTSSPRLATAQRAADPWARWLIH
jgi:hypothetical protein